MIELAQQFMPYLFTFVLAAAIAEIILSARWSRLYFSCGITILQRIITIKSKATRLPDAAQIEAALPSSGGRAPMLVRYITNDCIVFREKLFHLGIGYSPVMRGLITRNPGTGEIRVRGLLNWYVLLFSSSFLFFICISPPDPAGIIIPLCMLVLLAYIYWMQNKRYREVEDAVRKLLTE